MSNGPGRAQALRMSLPGRPRIRASVGESGGADLGVLGGGAGGVGGRGRGGPGARSGHSAPPSVRASDPSQRCEAQAGGGGRSPRDGEARGPARLQPPHLSTPTPVPSAVGSGRAAHQHLAPLASPRVSLPQSWGGGRRGTRRCDSLGTPRPRAATPEPLTPSLSPPPGAARRPREAALRLGGPVVRATRSPARRGRPRAASPQEPCVVCYVNVCRDHRLVELGVT